MKISDKFIKPITINFYIKITINGENQYRESKIERKSYQA